VRNLSKIILGVRDGLKIPGASVDYSNLEEKYLRYRPDRNDITKISNIEESLVIIPLQPYEPNLFILFKLAFDRIFNKLRSISELYYYHGNPLPKEIKNLSPLNDKNAFCFSVRPYRTHLKIGNQPFSYLKDSFDKVISKLRQFDLKRIPIVIESHTKQYHNYYYHINKFIQYIADNYNEDTEFGDISGFLKEIDENPKLVRSKYDNP
jgi:hypothetical protein